MPVQRHGPMPHRSPGLYRRQGRGSRELRCCLPSARLPALTLQWATAAPRRVAAAAAAAAAVAGLRSFGRCAPSRATEAPSAQAPHIATQTCSGGCGCKERLVWRRVWRRVRILTCLDSGCGRRPAACLPTTQEGCPWRLRSCLDGATALHSQLCSGFKMTAVKGGRAILLSEYLSSSCSSAWMKKLTA